MSADADRFVGAWRLVSLEARTSTGEVSYPYGKDAAGYLLYSREGYMSASVMQARRAHFASPDALAAPASEKLTAFDSYSSYSGRHEVRGQKVIHHVEISLFPNWSEPNGSGTEQERFFAFSGNQLMLTAPPMRLRGVDLTLVAIWRRLPSQVT
jgi:lipocalin-like protein